MHFAVRTGPTEAASPLREGRSDHMLGKTRTPKQHLENIGSVCKIMDDFASLRLTGKTVRKKMEHGL
jgi:hypothetical protein